MVSLLADCEKTVDIVTRGSLNTPSTRATMPPTTTAMSSAESNLRWFLRITGVIHMSIIILLLIDRFVVDGKLGYVSEQDVTAQFQKWPRSIQLCVDCLRVRACTRGMTAFPRLLGRASAVLREALAGYDFGVDFTRETIEYFGLLA